MTYAKASLILDGMIEAGVIPKSSKSTLIGLILAHGNMRGAEIAAFASQLMKDSTVFPPPQRRDDD